MLHMVWPQKSFFFLFFFQGDYFQLLLHSKLWSFSLINGCAVKGECIYSDWNLTLSEKPGPRVGMLVQSSLTYMPTLRLYAQFLFTFMSMS